MSWRTVAALVLVSGLLPSCGGKQPLSPTTPPPTSPTLISVTVGGTLSVFPGSTVQLTATANFAKGTTQDVTRQATWVSAAPAIATVSSTGLVTGVATGTAEIRATYQNVTGSAQMSVNRLPTLSGTVTETFPTTSTVLSGVRVEVMDGPNQGRFAMTDGSGHYQIAVSAGTASVKAHLDNYDDVTKSVTVTGDTSLGFALNPTAAQIGPSPQDGSVSGGDPATCSLMGAGTTYPCKVFPFAVHNAGSLNAQLGWATTAEAILVLQLYNADSNQVLSQTPLSPSETSTTTLLTLIASMSTPGNYQLRVVAWRIASTTSFTLITARPN